MDYFRLFEDFDYDRDALLEMARSFPESAWTRLLNYSGPIKGHWFEIQNVIASHPEIQKIWRRLALPVHPGQISLHKVPSGMGMPIHIDSSANDHPARKSILILPLTQPCPGTRFFEDGRMISAPSFQNAALVRVDVLHDIFNELEFDRLTVQFSFHQGFDELQELIRQNRFFTIDNPMNTLEAHA